MSFITRLFKKKSPTQDPNAESSKYIFSISIGLSADTSVDMSIELAESVSNPDHATKQSVDIAQFLHILTSGGMNQNISEMLVEQIGQDLKYKQVVDNILKAWIIFQKEYDKHKNRISSEYPLIKPTEVFGKYYSQ